MAAAPSDARVPGHPVAAPPIPAPPPADGVASWEPIVGAIGPKVRDLRQQHGLSLQQLAQRSGVSAAAIHKVERGDMVPTITTLLKLSAALGTPIGHFVEDGATAPVAVHVPAAARPVRDGGDGVALGVISGPPERFRGAGTVAEFAPGAESTGRPRPGEELLLVLEGALSVEVGGEKHALAEGDSLHYPTDRPHTWHNPTDGTTRAVQVWLPDS